MGYLIIAELSLLSRKNFTRTTGNLWSDLRRAWIQGKPVWADFPVVIIANATTTCYKN